MTANTYAPDTYSGTAEGDAAIHWAVPSRTREPAIARVGVFSGKPQRAAPQRLARCVTVAWSGAAGEVRIGAARKRVRGPRCARKGRAWRQRRRREDERELREVDPEAWNCGCRRC